MPESSDSFERMTKEQLIAEVKRLRAQLNAPPHSDCAGKPTPTPVSRAAREELTTTVEFIFDLDVVEAKGLNVSETGIAFVVEHAPPVELRFHQEGRDRQYKAELVRTQKNPDGGFLMGLRFAGELELPPLPDAPDDDSPSIDF